MPETFSVSGIVLCRFLGFYFSIAIFQETDCALRELFAVHLVVYENRESGVAAKQETHKHKILQNRNQISHVPKDDYIAYYQKNRRQHKHERSP